MSDNWHVKAARLQAENPHWTWRKACQELSRRSALVRKSKPKPKTEPKQLWYQND